MSDLASFAVAPLGPQRSMLSRIGDGTRIRALRRAWAIRWRAFTPLLRTFPATLGAVDPGACGWFNRSP
jgi:hypothetical protein